MKHRTLMSVSAQCVCVRKHLIYTTSKISQGTVGKDGGLKQLITESTPITCIGSRYVKEA